MYRNNSKFYAKQQTRHTFEDYDGDNFSSPRSLSLAHDYYYDDIDEGTHESLASSNESTPISTSRTSITAAHLLQPISNSTSNAKNDPHNHGNAILPAIDKKQPATPAALPLMKLDREEIEAEKRRTVVDLVKLENIEKNVANDRPEVSTRSEKIQKRYITEYIKKWEVQLPKKQQEYVVDEDNANEIIQAAASVDSALAEKIKQTLHKIQRNSQETGKQTMLQVHLLKGQLERRSQLLVDQRTSYLKELALLREELYRKQHNDTYNPNDFVMHNWHEFQNANMSGNNNQPPLNTERMEQQRLLFTSIQKQKVQVDETMDRLRKLEEERARELEKVKEKKRKTVELQAALELQQKELAAEKQKLLDQQLFTTNTELELRQRIIEQQNLPKEDLRKELEQLKLEKEQMEQEQLRRQKETEESHTAILNNFEEIESDDDERMPIQEQETTKAEITPVTEIKSEEPIVPLSPPMDLDLIIKPATPGLIEEETMEELETQISEFHHKFKGLFSKLSVLKKRLAFYEQAQDMLIIEEIKAPEGTVALVFTDVQDSTRLWEFNMEMMAKSIKLHNQEFRQLLKELNGYEVKTEGDAFMISFQRVNDAVEFCVTCQLRLLDQNWPDELLNHPSGKPQYDEQSTLIYRGLRVRMGIHMGTPILERDPLTGRADYFGPVVNRAARVAGNAQGGQIVVSNNVWKEISERLEQKYYSKPIIFKDLGLFSLKGIEEKEHIRMIAPEQLKNRTFVNSQGNEQQESSSISLLKQQLRKLQEEHEKLEKERNLIGQRIQTKVKIKALEQAMKEKDGVIQFMREKVELIKQTFAQFDSPSDEQRKISIEQSKQLQSDIDFVLQKYEQMKDQYDKVKNNYDNIVKVFGEKIKGEMELFKVDIQRMNDNVLEQEKEQLEIQRKWDIERKYLENEIEGKQRIIQEQEETVRKLRGELLASNYSLMRNRGDDKTDIPHQITKQLPMSKDLQLIDDSNQETNVPIDALTVEEVTDIFKKIISDMISTQNEYSNFDWNELIKGDKHNHVSPSNMISPPPNHVLHRVDTNRKKTLRIFDTQSNVLFEIPEDELRIWGLNRFGHLLSKPKPDENSSDLNQLRTIMRRKSRQLPSYSRTLEILKHSMEPSSYHPQAVVDEIFPISVTKKRKSHERDTNLAAYLEDALQSPFSREIKPNAKMKKWISLLVSKDGPLAKQFNQVTNPISNGEYNKMTRQQKRHEILNMLNQEKHAHQYLKSVLEPNEYKPISLTRQTTIPVDVTELELKERNTLNPSLRREPLLTQIDPSFTHFRNDLFGVFGINQDRVENIFEETAQVRRLIGLKKMENTAKFHSLGVGGRVTNEKSRHQLLPTDMPNIKSKNKKQERFLDSPISQFSRESSQSYFREYVQSSKFNIVDTEKEFTKASRPTSNLTLRSLRVAAVRMPQMPPLPRQELEIETREQIA